MGRTWGISTLIKSMIPRDREHKRHLGRGAVAALQPQNHCGFSSFRLWGRFIGSHSEPVHRSVLHGCLCGQGQQLRMLPGCCWPDRRLWRPHSVFWVEAQLTKIYSCLRDTQKLLNVGGWTVYYNAMRLLIGPWQNIPNTNVTNTPNTRGLCTWESPECI